MIFIIIQKCFLVNSCQNSLLRITNEMIPNCDNWKDIKPRGYKMLSTKPNSPPGRGLEIGVMRSFGPF